MKKLLGILVLIVLLLCQNRCTPQKEIVLLYFEETTDTIMVRCDGSELINIPCSFESDSVLTFSCENGTFAACGDTSHGPGTVPYVVYKSCIDTSHKDVMTVYFEETDETIEICCEGGEEINISCRYEDDGILTFTCQDGDSVSCEDDSDEDGI